MTSNESNQSSNEAYAIELQMAVTEQLGSQVRSLCIQVSDAGIILNGNCETYHIKQMVQEIVGKYTSRQIVSNRIVVSDTSNTISADYNARDLNLRDDHWRDG